MDPFIQGIPKAELHMHVEGSLEPELMFELADRNGVRLPFASVGEVRAAYAFEDLQSFLDVYYQGARVLLREEDFHDLAWAYLQRAHADAVRHAEIFFDPQTHTHRGVPYETVLNGLRTAQRQAELEFGMSTALIPNILRHLDADDAMETLRQVLEHRDAVLGLGLDSSEVGNPPSRFEAVFAEARRHGLRLVGHAGEEGPPAYIHEALDVLGVERIDHGVRCLEDDALVQRLVAERMPLTVCPFSNVKLRVFDRLEDHNLKALLERGLVVTVNSDDPAYFGGYVAENLQGVHDALGLDHEDVRRLARYSFEASFLDEERRAALLAEVDAFDVR